MGTLFCTVRTIWGSLQKLLLFLLRAFRGELPSRVVDGVVLPVNELGYGHHRQPLVDETLQYLRQSLRRVEGGVVEQHDAALFGLACHPLADGGGVVVLPVQAVTTGNKGKSCGTRICEVVAYSCNQKN